MPIYPWHQLKHEEIFKILNSSLHGLTEEEAALRLKKYGPNELPKEKPLGKLRLILNQLRGLLVIILIIASGISFFWGEHIDALVILAAVVLNVLVGFIQENKAQKALFKLRSYITHKVLVKRGETKKEILARELVPGDIFYLSPGDKIPADGRILEDQNLEVNEAVLTGESVPDKKQARVIKEKRILADRTNMVYAGTVVARGHGVAIVCQTASNTEFGKIAQLVKNVKEDRTPLQERLDLFSQKLGIFILGLCLVIFIIGVLTGQNFAQMFTLSVAVAVSAIPEGLLVGVTVILALGMQHILKKKGLVRKLLAAETLGATSVICTDKTGTLTEGQMRVSKIITPQGEEINLKEALVKSPQQKILEKILRTAVLCNNAVVEEKTKDQPFKIIGEPTETALMEKALELGIDIDKLNQEQPRLDEIPFESKNKYMATLNAGGKNNDIVHLKGAPEEIIKMSTRLANKNRSHALSGRKTKELLKLNENLSSQGYRLLAVAYQEINSPLKSFKDVRKLLDKIIFLGFLVLEDPLRPEAKETIALTKKAGIHTVVITGDHRLTAKKIAEELGLPVTRNSIMEGQELQELSFEELKKRIDKINIYARTSPEDKLRIVEAWQQKGEVVAMTGDGVNDAPALKKSDIGLALGSGSDVAKETSDLVLLDNNFKTIVESVREGRIIYSNIKKVILYLLSDSFSEVLIIAATLIISIFHCDFPLPLLAAQILWINLVTDGFPYIALTAEPGDPEIMKEKPRPKKDPILNYESKLLIFLISIFTAASTLLVFYFYWQHYQDVDLARTMAFSLLALDSLIYVFSARDLKHSVLHKNFFTNKYLFLALLGGLAMQAVAVYLPFFQRIFRTVSLGVMDWIIIVLGSAAVIFLIEVVKYVFLVRKKTS